MLKSFPILGLATSLLCITGCQNPGVVRVSANVYTLARADHAGIFGNKDALKASVLRDANAFAENQGKVAIPISAKEHPVGIMGDWASFEYNFKVVDRNNPEAQIPKVLVLGDYRVSPEFRGLGGKDVFYTAQVVK